MHLYVLARGINDCLARWENDVSAIYLPIKANLGGKVENCRVRTAVRPVQLYEIVFPEESLNEILETIPQTGGQNKWLARFKGILQKAMGLQNAPLRKHNGKVHAPHVGITYIGIKKDVRDKLGCEML